MVDIFFSLISRKKIKLIPSSPLFKHNALFSLEVRWLHHKSRPMMRKCEKYVSVTLLQRVDATEKPLNEKSFSCI